MRAAAAAIKIRSKETERMFGIRVETSLRVWSQTRERKPSWARWHLAQSKHAIITANLTISGSGQFVTSLFSEHQCTAQLQQNPLLVSLIISCVAIVARFNVITCSRVRVAT